MMPLSAVTLFQSSKDNHWLLCMFTSLPICKGWDGCLLGFSYSPQIKALQAVEKAK